MSASIRNYLVFDRSQRRQKLCQRRSTGGDTDCESRRVTCSKLLNGLLRN